MIPKKKTLAFAFLTITPLIGLGAIQWRAPSSPERSSHEWAELRERAERLELELQDARRQVGETLDMLEGSVKEGLRRHRNCAPSRNSLVFYQWLDANQHDERAARFLGECVKVLGRGHRQQRNILRYAWSLMTERKTAGKFDRVALALAEHVVDKHPQLDGDAFDTIALAKFLDGQIESAIDLERQAVASEEGNEDFRRRLRMYEAARDAAALRVAANDAPSLPRLEGAVAKHEDAAEPAGEASAPRD